MRCALVLLVPFLLSAQPAFEVASIRAAPPQPMGRTSIRRSTDKGRLNYLNVSIADIISDAYRVPRRQISGPEWIDTQRFDILAKIPDGKSDKDVPEMLQSLLAERFGLKLHYETKEMPVYALVAVKTGPKMQKSETVTGITGRTSNSHAHLSAKTTMANLANDLSARLDRPVTDRTGLEGAYAFELDWTVDTGAAQPADANTEGPSIFTALQEQLGLRLAAEKGPVKFLIIDHVEKVPAEN